MSQFPASYSDPFTDPYGPEQKTSGLAIGALVCSLIGIIPCLGVLTGVLGIVLGAAGVATIGKDPAVKGKGLCIAAIILGLVFVTTQIVAGKYAYDFFYGYYEYVITAPANAINSGYGGDYAAFKGHFHGAGATAPDAEAQAFIEQLRSRYGAFIGFKVNDSGGPTQSRNQPEIKMPVIFEFGKGKRDGEIMYIFGDKTGQGDPLMKKLGYIIVRDPDQGDLAFPSSASTGSSPSPAAPAAPADPPADPQDSSQDGG